MAMQTQTVQISGSEGNHNSGNIAVIRHALIAGIPITPPCSGQCDAVQAQRQVTKRENTSGAGEIISVCSNDKQELQSGFRF
ncbi:hypothetical protein [Lelliottia amnigena]|uniref:hypothetical protein n=1 Tax=Lelliottia amnigena TaxID=61646 RepID=UPI0021D9EF66|nr:hypothetical protein [Lelliottia amnigena]